jgi:CheY-like chemotaxis protein
MIAAPGVLQTAARTALVVDDEVVVRMVLRRFFARHGWTVVEAETGEEALALMSGEAMPEIVVCDLNLPGLSGADVCRRISEMHPTLAGRLVLLSGDPISAELAVEREALHCPVLGKPFSLTDLERVVNSVALAE